MKNIFLISIYLSLSLTALFADDRDFNFAEALYQEGDYYRAISEYKRFLFFNPSDEKAALSEFRVGLCYRFGKKYADADSALTIVETKYKGQELALKAKFVKGLVWYEAGDNEATIKVFAELFGEKPEYILAEQGRFLEGFAYLRKWDWQAANGSFTKFLSDYPSSSLRAKAEILSKKTDEFRKKTPEKSPALAGILSAVIPGSGQLYSERISDGLSAFLWNLTLGYLTYSSYDSEIRLNPDPSKRNFSTVYTVGSVFTLFYLSNVYGAINSARNANYLIRVNFVYSAMNDAGDEIKLILDQKF